MKIFNFSDWINNCSFSNEEAAKVLEIPVALVEYYIVTQDTIPEFRIKKAKQVLDNRKKALEAKEADNRNNNHLDAKRKSIFNELLICLNIESEKHGGGMFWDSASKGEYCTNFQKAMAADIQGFRLKTMKIQTNFEDNKFQPHEKVQTKQMPVFYMIDLLSGFSNQEEFSNFISMRPQFREKRRKLSEKNINYVYDFNINNILMKVFN